ncbi:MAG: PmoA family protein [Sediminicola sp.]
MLRTKLLIAIMGLLFSCKEKQKEVPPMESPTGVSFRKDDNKRKVEVLINNVPFTSYIYDGSTPKPILYPILTQSGKAVTRGFPLEPIPGERTDHPHHVGSWFNYGDVNGLDFWNNSYAIPEAEKSRYGTINFKEIVGMDEKNGTLTTKATWDTPDNVSLLEEKTKFTFLEEGTTRKIIRETTLYALQDVNFKDNKEGLIGIRVARSLEMPSEEPAEFIDANRVATKVEVLNNEGVDGNYLSSENIKGDQVWGTRAKWTMLSGKVQGEPVSITIMDHPNNIGYPTYWHARGYGLFAANPLGQEVFSEGKETLNHQLKKGESVTFKYAIMVHNGKTLSPADVEKEFATFTKK